MYNFISSTLFTVVANILAAFVLTVVILKYRKNKNELQIFLPYAVISVLQTLFTIIIVSYNPLNLDNTSFVEYFINLFTVLEILIFSFFFYSIFQSKFVRQAIITVCGLFLLWFFYLWIYKGQMNIISDLPTVFETFFFISLCLFYFYELFKHPPTVRLVQSSTFWAVTGIFLLCSLLFPLFLFKDELLNVLPTIYLNFYAVNHIGYTVLFFCLIKATLCKVNPTS